MTVSERAREHIDYARTRVHGWRHNDPEKRPKEIRAMDALLDHIDALEAALSNREAVIEKAGDLLRVLDEAKPHISGAIQIATIHHCPYSGPDISPQVRALEEAIRNLGEEG